MQHIALSCVNIASDHEVINLRLHSTFQLIYTYSIYIDIYIIYFCSLIRMVGDIQVPAVTPKSDLNIICWQISVTNNVKQGNKYNKLSFL